MYKIGAVTVTKQKNYNQVKHYVANMVLIFTEKYLPSTRDIAEILHIDKSSVGRAVLALAEEKWLEKIQQGNSPRNSIYKIIANYDQCFAFKQYFLLPIRRKAKFRAMFKHVGQLPQEGAIIKTKEGAIKHAWYFGSSEWNEATRDII